jgi:hypothetical protein
MVAGHYRNHAARQNQTETLGIGVSCLATFNSGVRRSTCTHVRINSLSTETVCVENSFRRPSQDHPRYTHHRPDKRACTSLCRYVIQGPGPFVGAAEPWATCTGDHRPLGQFHLRAIGSCTWAKLAPKQTPTLWPFPRLTVAYKQHPVAYELVGGDPWWKGPSVRPALWLDCGSHPGVSWGTQNKDCDTFCKTQLENNTFCFKKCVKTGLLQKVLKSIKKY